MKRGELWWEVPDPIASPYNGSLRPVVVSSSNWWNKAKPPLVAVVPIASNGIPTPHSIEVPAGTGGLPNKSALLPEHLRYVDRRRLFAPIGGELSGETMAKLRDVLLLTL